MMLIFAQLACAPAGDMVLIFLNFSFCGINLCVFSRGCLSSVTMQVFQNYGRISKKEKPLPHTHEL